MDELFRQLAFISAILGGFAITFLSVLLTTAQTSRFVNQVVGVAMGAAVCFVLTAVGSTFSAVVASGWTPEGMANAPARLHEPLSMLFLSGIVLLFGMLGLSGWIRSRELGIVTSVVAAVALVAGYFIVRPFIA